MSDEERMKIHFLLAAGWPVYYRGKPLAPKPLVIVRGAEMYTDLPSYGKTFGGN